MCACVCVCVMAAGVSGTITSNLQTSARYLIGQRAGSVLNSLKDVKDKVQSIAPALPKLLPNTILESNAANGAKRQSSVSNLPADSCQNLAVRDKGGQLQKERNYCECDRPMDAVLAQESVSNSVCNGSVDVCHKAATCESTELPSELSANLCIDVSNHTCDQNFVASSAMQDAEQSSNFSERFNQFHIADNIDCIQSVRLSQSMALSHEGEQNLPSSECELQQHSNMASQSAVLNCPTEVPVRRFSACVDDCPDIIYASARKRTKPAKRGIDNLVMFLYAQKVFCHFIVYNTGAAASISICSAAQLALQKTREIICVYVWYFKN